MNGHTDRLSEVKARLAERSGLSDQADDLTWAVEEIEYLRRYNAALSEYALAIDGLRWALEHPAPGRVERRSAAEEEARQALSAIPLHREGECERGCRRYATHELVMERADEVTRKRYCEECGQVKAMATQALVDAGHLPPALVRLQPIANQDEGKGERA